MDSPQKKAGSMDGKMPRLLPLTVAKKTPHPAPDVVRQVSAWALFTACIFAVSFTVSFTVGYAIAYALDHFHVPFSQSFSFLPSHQLTDAEEAVENSLEIWMLCCVALQAAAAVLALWLPCRRRWVRRALAYPALAFTIAGHCMYPAAARFFLGANPGDLLYKICFAVGIVFLAAGDIISFLALLLGGE